MSIKSKVAIAAALFSAIASPSFAAVQLGVGADPVSDGRFAPAIDGQTAVYARYMAPKRTQAPNWTTEMQINDRLSQGHN